MTDPATDTTLDTSALDNWLDPTLIEDAARALRSDGAAYGDQSDEVDPVWRNLQAYFRVWGMGLDVGADEDRIFWAGAQVSNYGDAIRQGTDNIAKALEDLASRIRELQTERKNVLKDARKARTRLDKHPAPTVGYYDPDYAGQEEEHTNAVNNAAVVDLDIECLASDYDRALGDADSAIKGLKDDGSTPLPFIGALFNAATFALAVFIPPAGAALAAVGAAKTLYDTYQARMRELRETHPEMTDNAMNSDALARTATAAPVVVVLSAATYKGGEAAGQLTRVLAPGLPDAAYGASAESAGWLQGQEWYAVLDDAVVSSDDDAPNATSPGRASGGVGTSGPPIGMPPAEWDAMTASERRKVERQIWLNDPVRIQKTGDYDRDGFTDAPFIPGATVVQHPPNWTEDDYFGSEIVETYVPAEEVVSLPRRGIS